MGVRFFSATAGEALARSLDGKPRFHALSHGPEVIVSPWFLGVDMGIDEGSVSVLHRREADGSLTTKIIGRTS